jgi:hypothetical protein
MLTACAQVTESLEQPDVPGLQPHAAADAGDNCDADGWSTFTREGAFSFRGPCELRGGPEQGVDSRVGSYRLPGMVLWYDYGGYSSPLTEWNMYADYSTRPSTVDGHDAIVVTAANRSATDGLPYLTGIHVPEVSRAGLKLTVFAQSVSESERELLLRMFQTIRF